MAKILTINQPPFTSLHILCCFLLVSLLFISGTRTLTQEGSGGSKGQSPGSRPKHAPSKGQYTPPATSTGTSRPFVADCSRGTPYRNCLPRPKPSIPAECDTYKRNCYRAL
ncbi:hypothetical protein COLO4_03765 [Corchorus olitorius]|uniref:Rapid ALkalinization Factor n=1 Tax=Corchorus olitorius TaxID=93759 RepID=A0A1R3KWR5_9ROSI|nr:hypothetical protein COLO4_03765 [Corchorus olitorius]